ncbi:hypothetical protein Acr_09g0007560 [Actinidia rufa]|uniref:Uncharacterized protein n=1 Tax=Actinidia rufa TaxID=165716 RepID=A0A7J0F6K6_9ERIC|nr:hypothetical protein Acr_09g0007560 [Actinidia rufa]
MVESYNTERALRKIKRHSSSAALDVNKPDVKLENQNQSVDQKEIGDLSGHHVERLKLISEERGVSHSNSMEGLRQSPEQDKTTRDVNSKGADFDIVETSLALHGWQNMREHGENGGKNKTVVVMAHEVGHGHLEMISEVVVVYDLMVLWFGSGACVLRWQSADSGALIPNTKLEESRREKPSDADPGQLLADLEPTPPDGAVETGEQTNGKKTLVDAVKPKHKRRKKKSSNIDAS